VLYGRVSIGAGIPPLKTKERCCEGKLKGPSQKLRAALFERWASDIDVLQIPKL
jgi:hypothetical protein